MKELFDFMDIVKGNYLKDMGKVFGIIFIIQLCLEFYSIYIGKATIAGHSFVSFITIGIYVVVILNDKRNKAIRENGTFVRLMMLPSKYKYKTKMRYFYSEFLFYFIGIIIWFTICCLSDFFLLIMNMDSAVYETNSLFYLLLQSEFVNNMMLYQFSSPMISTTIIFMILYISVLCTINPIAGIDGYWLFLTIPFLVVSTVIILIGKQPIFSLIYSMITFIISSLLARFIYLRSDLK